jgi:quercetin dioxygenase-like cupin family protein
MRVHDWREVHAEEAPGFPGVSLRWVISEREGAGRFAMRVFEVEPGAEIPLHDHWYEQEMFVLDGEGVACTPEGETPMRPGAVLWVAPHERHGFRNAGDGVLRFICCVPLAEAAADAAAADPAAAGAAAAD